MSEWLGNSSSLLGFSYLFAFLLPSYPRALARLGYKEYWYKTNWERERSVDRFKHNIHTSNQRSDELHKNSSVSIKILSSILLSFFPIIATSKIFSSKKYRFISLFSCYICSIICNRFINVSSRTHTLAS